MNKILAKLRGMSGETIAETLISLLISALALVMLAGAIGAAKNIITGSNDAMNEYYSNSGSGDSGWYEEVVDKIP